MIGQRIGFGACEFYNLIADHARLAVSGCQRLLFDDFLHRVIANSADVTALGSMDHIPEQELCVTAIHQITAIGLHRAGHDGTLIGFLQCSHGCQQGTEHPEQYKEAVLIHVKIAIRPFVDFQHRIESLVGDPILFQLTIQRFSIQSQNLSSLSSVVVTRFDDMKNVAAFNFVQRHQF